MVEVVLSRIYLFFLFPDSTLPIDQMQLFACFFSYFLCGCMYTFVCVYACAHVRAFVCVYACAHVRAFVCMCMHARSCMRAFVCECGSACVGHLHL